MYGYAGSPSYPPASYSRKRMAEHDRSAEKRDKRHRKEVRERDKKIEFLEWEMEKMRNKFQQPAAAQKNNDNIRNEEMDSNHVQRRPSSPTYGGGEGRYSAPRPRSSDHNNLQLGHDQGVSSGSNGFGQYQDRQTQQHHQQRQPSLPPPIPGPSHRERSAEPAQVPTNTAPRVVGKHNLPPVPPVPREGDTIPALDSKQGIGMLSLTVLRESSARFLLWHFVERTCTMLTCAQPISTEQCSSFPSSIKYKRNVSQS